MVHLNNTPHFKVLNYVVDVNMLDYYYYLKKIINIILFIEKIICIIHTEILICVLCLCCGFLLLWGFFVGFFGCFFCISLST